jgi:hypothetical protein
MAEKTGLLGLITKIIFIGGAIVLFILLAIWIIRWVPKFIADIGNVGTSVTDTLRGGDVIRVQVNNDEINTGEPFVVSWEHEPSKPGEYYISYTCEEALMLDIQSSGGNKRIICNTPFKLGEEIRSVSLIPTLTRQNIFVDSEIKISYKDFEENKEIAYGEAVATLKNTNGSGTNPYDASLAGSTVTSTPAEDSSSSSAGTSGSTGSVPQIGGNTVAPSYYYEKSDLALTNIARTGNQSALSFTVYNYGNRSTGNWFFSYTDAENPSRTMMSPAQPSLAPGQGLFVTVRFDGQRYDDQVIAIFLDPSNIILETNEWNNTGSVVIQGGRGGSRYYDYDEDDEADLVIEDMEVGRMSGSRFIEDDEIDEGDDAAVRFKVRNQGGEDTGRWRFEIDNVPNDDDDEYRSGRQDSLYPGEQTTITVEFENADEGNYNIRVEVDSDDDVDEEKENNNTESERLEVRN